MEPVVRNLWEEFQSCLTVMLRVSGAKGDQVELTAEVANSANYAGHPSVAFEHVVVTVDLKDAVQEFVVERLEAGQVVARVFETKASVVPECTAHATADLDWASLGKVAVTGSLRSGAVGLATYIRAVREFRVPERWLGIIHGIPDITERTTVGEIAEIKAGLARERTEAGLVQKRLSVLLQLIEDHRERQAAIALEKPVAIFLREASQAIGAAAESLGTTKGGSGRDLERLERSGENVSQALTAVAV